MLSVYTTNQMLAVISSIPCYVGLYNGDPANSGTDYSSAINTAGRQLITWSTPSEGVISNTVAIAFGNSLSSAIITYVGIFDSVTGGNLLSSGELATPINILAGNVVTLPANTLLISID